MSDGEPKIPALVLGTSVSALGAMRALGRKGIPTYVLTAPGDLTTRSRYYRPFPGAGTTQALGAPGADALARALEGVGLPRAFLLPCTDLWVEAAVALRERFGDRFATSLPPAEAVEVFLDKGKLATLLGKLGLPHPRTAIVSGPAALELLEGWDFSQAFLKPRSSPLFMERFRVKAFRVANRGEAAARLAEIAPTGLEIVLQEYVPGPATHHHFIDGFVDATGRVRARFARRRLRMYPPDFGNSTALVSISPAEVAPAMESLERLLAHLRFRGIFSAEFKKDARDGAFRLLEVNVRPWWYVDFAETSGVEVVDLAYRDALGLPLRDILEYPVGRKCVYPYFDMAGYFDARKAGLNGSSEWPGLARCAATWLTANQPVFAWDDPRPAMTNLWMLCKRSFQTKILRRKS